MRLGTKMNETMFKNIVFDDFLLTKNINIIFCLKYSLQREHPTLTKQDFLCIKVTLHLSILLQLIQLMTAI